MSAETIIHNAKIAANGVPSFVEAVAIGNGKIIGTGKNDEILRQRGPETKVIDGIQPRSASPFTADVD